MMEEESAELCDGIHDETAPEGYLCTRCFPQGRPKVDNEGDLHVPDDVDVRAESEEIS